MSARCGLRPTHWRTCRSDPAPPARTPLHLGVSLTDRLNERRIRDIVQMNAAEYPSGLQGIGGPLIATYVLTTSYTTPRWAVRAGATTGATKLPALGRSGGDVGGASGPDPRGDHGACENRGFSRMKAGFDYCFDFASQSSFSERPELNAVVRIVGGSLLIHRGPGCPQGDQQRGSLALYPAPPPASLHRTPPPTPSAPTRQARCVDEAGEHLKSWIDNLEAPDIALAMIQVCGCTKAAVVDNGERVMVEMP
jgi:hypothetical protein